MPEDNVDDQGTWLPEESEEIDDEQEEAQDQEDQEQEAEQQDAAQADEEKVEAKAEETQESAPADEEALPPSNWSPTIPQNLYTDDEQAWLERTQDDPDPKIRLQASQFMINRSQEFHAKAMLVAQAQMSSIPQPFMAVHGPVVAEYLNTIVAPERRGSPEASQEAKAWAILQRAKQIGDVKAYREAANLLEGQRPVVVSPPPAPKPAPVPKTPIPAEQRVPTGGTGLNPSQTVKRTNRGVERIGAALGIEMD